MVTSFHMLLRLTSTKPRLVKSAIEGTFSSAILATNLPTPAVGQRQHIQSYAFAGCPTATDKKTSKYDTLRCDAVVHHEQHGFLAEALPSASFLRGHDVDLAHLDTVVFVLAQEEVHVSGHRCVTRISHSSHDAGVVGRR
jgi:hypothetical protein